MARKITLESTDVPSIKTLPNNGQHRVQYGRLRGWRQYKLLPEAQEELLGHLNNRIHSAAHQLEALCKAQRKLLKEMSPEVYDEMTRAVGLRFNTGDEQ